MSKYTLVASYYDKYEKNPNLKYKYEIEISLPGIELSTLQAIDNFTSSHTYFEIFQLLEYNKNIIGRNHLSIKYQKTKTAQPIYYKVIENRRDFTPITKDNIVKKYFSLNKWNTSLVVQNNNELFQKEKRKLIKIIEEKNLEEFITCFPYEQADLYHLVNRYINTDYDDDIARNEDYMQIMNEFSRYKTFRGWFIATNIEKNKSIVTTKNKKVVSDVQLSKPIIHKKKEEYEEEYVKKFLEKNRVTYENYQTYQYNTSQIQNDKEEFLEESEVIDLQEQYDFLEEDLNKSNVRRRHH